MTYESVENSNTKPQTKRIANNIHLCTISLGDGRFAYVSPIDFERISKHKWYAKKFYGRWYAVRRVCHNGKVYEVRMHRQIMFTPRNMIVHHINYNGLDNRRENLTNMRQEGHQRLHRLSRIGGKPLVKTMGTIQNSVL